MKSRITVCVTLSCFFPRVQCCLSKCAWTVDRPLQLLCEHEREREKLCGKSACCCHCPRLRRHCPMSRDLQVPSYSPLIKNTFLRRNPLGGLTCAIQTRSKPFTMPCPTPPQHVIYPMKVTTQVLREPKLQQEKEPHAIVYKA